MAYAIIIIPILSYVLWSLVSLVRNIQIAKTIGCPVVWSPISCENPLWLVLSKSVVPVLQKLPFGLGEWTKHGTLDWTWVDRLQGGPMHQRHGKLFAHANPDKIEIFTVDAAISAQVLTKKREFPKPFEVAKVLDIYGPSLGSVDDENWARHRKITAGSFADKNNRGVWQESVRQARQIADFYTAGAAKDACVAPEVRSLARDTLTLSIHVLTNAAFGIQYDFRSATEEVVPAGHKRSYRQCLQAVLHDVLLLLVVPHWVYKLPVLPKKLADFRDYSHEFKQYMVESVESCKAAVNAGTVTGTNLLTSLVEKNEEARQLIDAGGPSSGKGMKGLRDDELYGNLFVYSFGGHETTAHTLSYAIYLLAAFPDVQDWLAEELKEVARDVDFTAEDAFDDAFPRLKRCLAVMFETLRVFPTVTSIPKTTGPTPSRVELDGREYTLPPNARVYVNIPTLHMHPDNWGPDAMQWKPSRWVAPTADASAAATTTTTTTTTDADAAAAAAPEEIKPPHPKGAFAPWGDGPRVCPGRRFAQVEFVATIAALLSEHRVEVVPSAPGESVEDARRRAWETVSDSFVALTLTMRRPEAVSLRLVKR